MKKLLIATCFVMASSLFAQQQGGCVAIGVGSQQKGNGRFDTTFSATGVIDVDFSVLFTQGAAKRFSGAHRVEFRIYTPKGHLYQSIAIPFTVDAAVKGKKVTIPDYPQPISTQLLTPVSYNNASHLAASVRLPVAGTPILTNSLYGTWTAQAYVDGETVGCSKPVSFQITQ
jgi:hypothetical protein